MRSKERNLHKTNAHIIIERPHRKWTRAAKFIKSLSLGDFHIINYDDRFGPSSHSSYHSFIIPADTDLFVSFPLFAHGTHALTIKQTRIIFPLNRLWHQTTNRKVIRILKGSCFDAFTSPFLPLTLVSFHSHSYHTQTLWAASVCLLIFMFVTVKFLLFARMCVSWFQMWYSLVSADSRTITSRPWLEQNFFFSMLHFLAHQHNLHPTWL